MSKGWPTARLGFDSFYTAIFMSLLLVFTARFAVTGHGVDGDGIEYYSYLPSILLDHDLNFTNQCEGFYGILPGLYVDYREPPTGQARIFSQGPPQGENDPLKVKCSSLAEYGAYAYHNVGCAVLWAPFFIASMALTYGLNLIGFGLRADGLGALTQYLTVASSTLYATAGLILAEKIGLRMGIASKALRTSITALLAGTFLLQYFALEPSMSQAVDYFTVTLFFFWAYTRFFYAPPSGKDWIILGAISGLAVDVRPQNALMIAPALAYLALKALLSRDIKGPAVLIVSGLAASAPLLVVNISLYGSFTASQQTNDMILYFSPKLYEVLLSFRHSLLVSTPLIALSLLGFALLLRDRKRDAFIWLLLAGLIVQVYLNAAIVDWWAGSAPGARRFAGISLVYILGLACLFERFRVSRYRMLIYALTACLVIFNLIYLFAYNLHLIDANEAVTYWDIIRAFVGFASGLTGR